MDNNHKPAYGDSFKYATKVWWIGALAGPVLVVAWQEFERLDVPVPGDRCMGSHWSEYPFFFILVVLCGAFCSIPSWLVLWLATALVNRLSWAETARKFLLVGIATVLTILPFPLLDVSESWGLILCYWLAIAAGILYFRLGPAAAKTQAEIAHGEANEIPD